MSIIHLNHEELGSCSKFVKVTIDYVDGKQKNDTTGYSTTFFYEIANTIHAIAQSIQINEVPIRGALRQLGSINHCIRSDRTNHPPQTTRTEDAYAETVLPDQDH